MKYAEIEKYCLSLKAATLSVQWGDHHVFKVGNKMFAMLGDRDAEPQTMSFKTAEDSFAILTKGKHVIPAPYLARARWVQLQKLDALGTKDLKAYLARAHAIVAAGLTKKLRVELGLED